MNNNQKGTNTSAYSESEEFFGDKISIKDEETLRISFININGIPAKNEDYKNMKIYEAIQENQIDILGMTEINRNWNMVEEESKWRERTFGWWESSNTTMGFNVNDSIASNYQPGGTMLISIDRPAHRIIETGRDETGLGRWVWQKYRGKQEITLRVVTAYRPCTPSSAGPGTAHSQQERYLDLKGDNRTPRTALLEDLKKEMETWQQEGDQIVLLMDANENVSAGTIKMWAQELHLREVISTHHGEKEPTYNRGSKPIDGIFTSASITPIRSGYLPFGAFPSDHRLLYMDILYDNAFGYKMPQMVKPPERRLKCNDPVTKKRWQSLYKEYIKEHNIDERIFKLEAEAESPLTKAQAKEYENLLTLKRKGIEYADKKCRKLRMGAVPYSDSIKQAGVRIELWKAVITKKTGTKYSMTKLRRLEKKAGIKQSMGRTLTQAKNELKEAEKKYKEKKKIAEALRETFLEKRAKEVAKEKDMVEWSVQKQLIDRERVRQSARRIKYTLRKLRGGGVSRVEIPDSNGTTKVITKKEEIEKACMEENNTKYLQTSNTPFMKGNLLEEIGYDGMTEAGDQILKGNYSPPAETGRYTRELINQLKRTEHNFEHTPEAAIKTQSFKEGWKKIKENTSAGISGTHFGHLKASAENAQLAEVEASFAHIPYMSGFSPTLWQYGVIVMIRKKAKSDMLKDLRSVVLTEAEWNFNNKVLGKTTLEHAEKHNLLPPEQYGSRKGKKSIDHVINKRLTYDILRQTRRPGLLCSNDAKSCFDRVVHSVAMLAYRRLGIPHPPVLGMIKTIQNMKHHIRTTYGDSTFVVDAEGELKPYQGLLQGNGASPATWVIISAPLIEMMREAQNGGFFKEPISNICHHIVGYAFVDDTDLIELEMDNDTRTLEEAVEAMQEAIHRWEGGLKATGGAIRPDKSWVYPIGFKFDNNGKWKYDEDVKEKFIFRVKDHEEIMRVMPTMNPSEGKETLGVFLAPDGNNKKMIEYLTEKTESWSDLVRTGHLNKKDARQALETTIMKSVEYGLPALTLSEEECKKIMKPVLKAGLPNMGICRNFPRDVTYGPTNEGGIGLTDIYTFQGTSRIATLQENLNAKTITGNLIRTSIEAAKIELGIGRNIFDLNYDLYNHMLTDCWIKHIWKFAHQNKIIIEDEITKDMPLLRENDVYLMEIITESKQFTKGELAHINRCRLHLQVYAYSEIVCGFSEKFTSAYHCERDSTRPKRKMIWPIQPKPGKRSIGLWKRALRYCFPAVEGSLTYKVGRWTQEDDNWIWYYHKETKRLIQRCKNGTCRIWRRQTTRGRIGRKPKFKFFARGLQIPVRSVRATIIRVNKNTAQLTGWEEENISNINHTMHWSQRWIEEDCHTTEEEDKAIAEAAQSNKLTVVSDGSFCKTNKFGTAGWVIESQGRQVAIQGSLVVPGDPDIQSSHRSELAGILGAIHKVDQICKKYNINNGQVTVGCDGKGAIDALQYEHDIIKSSRKHFDLISAITNIMKESEIQYNRVHIKGHQDDIFEFDQLTRLEQLNVAADLIAKERLHKELEKDDIQRESSRPQRILRENSAIYWEDPQGKRIKISSHLQKSLTSYIQRTKIRNYWKEKGKFSSYTERKIDWEHTTKSHGRNKKMFNQWLSKWITGICGVGVMMKLWKFQDHSKCPRCQEDEEDTIHVLRCPHQSAKETWNESLKELDKWIEENDGHPELRESIIKHLSAWHDNRQPTAETYNNTSINQAVHNQNQIGWQSFIEGFLAKEWTLCQKEHMRKSKKSPTLWMAKLQNKIWQIAWTMWEHRNKHLHEKNEHEHITSLEALNEQIRIEMEKGLETLPRRYSRLFKTSLQVRLKDSTEHKRQWLTSVWAARDRIHQDEGQGRDAEVRIFYDRWKKRHDRQG